MPRTLTRLSLGIFALLIGSAPALAAPASFKNDLICTASNGISVHVPDGSGRFMQEIVLHGTPDLLGDLVDKKAASTTEDTLRLSYGFSPTCALTNGASIACDGTSLASATYNFFDQSANESITVRKQLHVRESKIEITKDSNGIYQLNFKIVTHPLAGRERVLEIIQALGPATHEPNPWNPGCESVPRQL